MVPNTRNCHNRQLEEEPPRWPPKYSQCTGFDVCSHRTITVCFHDPPGALRTRKRTPPAYPYASRWDDAIDDRHTAPRTCARRGV
eukprot:717851-Prymnesium_polylepis.1